MIQRVLATEEKKIVSPPMLYEVTFLEVRTRVNQGIKRDTSSSKV
uniref:Uncharacterized protein n=1 Tax=Brassica campestris TaxID=3711 RepID=A0A3P6AC58_BRACM|nr:unnamed protein product [Brassica rapa]